jgi:hypothetical protein
MGQGLAVFVQIDQFERAVCGALIDDFAIQLEIHRTDALGAFFARAKEALQIAKVRALDIERYWKS